ncbi:V8-like Glu-specific endopeptidase [Spirosoma lacussanchae]|uniref:trypsin-like serine peptidase n=1 Tax=Spirosoma lacussanchae TaxID=1884249 RepID=UPI001107E7A0|nr:serine protease [Spirosoma lacussanchae]
MNWNETLTILNYRLARLYRQPNAAIAVVERANYNTLQIDISGNPAVMWFNILDYARTTANNWNKIIALLEVVTSPNEMGAEDETLKGILENLKKGQVPVEPPKPVAVAAVPPVEEKRLEKIMGSKSTLLPISFLEQGLVCARAVVRVVTPAGLGTGFLVGDNYVITNNHVIDSIDTARQSVLQFNFQKTLQGLDAPVEEFSLDPDAAFTTSTDRPETAVLDYTIVKVKGNPAAKYGTLTFSPTAAKKEDFVNIIQHPAGGPKQIALYHNVVTGVDEQVVQYLTDTLPGSSGSPVFNSAWQVVALHHAGGELVDPESSQTVVRNQGINGLRVKEAFDQLIA